MADGRFERAIAAIDTANADDPNTIDVHGVPRPKEQAHAELMTEWVLRLDPAADDAQLLAARAHHLRRWASPRDAFSKDRAGYLRWRAAAKKRHAEEVAEILGRVGYDPATIERVGQIVRKEGLKTDPAVQTHEDALCLVFLETQLTALAADLGDEHTVEVVAKTIGKMSDRGIESALALPLVPEARSLLLRAAGAPS